jgi:quercetin dioxygenase-like cupin family protein
LNGEIKEMNATKTETSTKFVGHDEGEWIFSAPGVMKKALYSDETSGELTLLLRFEKNSTYPLHNHPGKEEIVILKGDIKIGKYELKFGDYLFTPPEGKHAVSSKDGCLLVIKLAKPIEIIERKSEADEY